MSKKFVTDGVELKKCAGCKDIKATSEYSHNAAFNDLLHPYCKICRAKQAKEYRRRNTEKARQARYTWAKNNPEVVAVYSRKTRLKKYGITPEEWDRMYVLQNGCCAVCGLNETLTASQKLCVDHNHTTGKVRELLCHKCNCALGNFNESVEILLKAIEYVKKHAANV